MNCDDVNRWLDQGRPGADDAATHAHAAACPRCAAALSAALEIDALLASDLAAAPAALTDHVMARVALARRAEWRLEPPAFDWWVRAAAEPSVALALVAAALLLWRGDLLLAPASQGLAWLGAGLASMSAMAPATFAPATRAALWLTMLIAAPWASWLLFRWSETLARSRVAGRGGAGAHEVPRARIS